MAKKVMQNPEAVNGCERGTNPSAIDRRVFGKLVATAGAAALLPTQSALASYAGEPVNAVQAASGAPVVFKTKHAAFSINSVGAVSAIECNGRNCLAAGVASPLLSLRIAGKYHAPTRATWQKSTAAMTLHFEDIAATAFIGVRTKPSHISLELVELHCNTPVEVALWGPYPTNINDLVGEVVGVVHDRVTAVGIQALNTKTLGGYPTQESDIAPDGVLADDKGTYPGLPEELKKQQRWRGDTATATDYGSSLQAYCRNRDRQREISNWGNDKFIALPFDDGGVIGSKIALFACAASDALGTIGDIEIAENLPHPIINGVWAKMSPDATQSYLIVDFGEATIDRAIEMTRQAGLKFLYQSSPFETWGHFKLKPALFPNGWDGFRSCVQKAAKVGIGIGFHTLSNFITPNDPYVTPTPDRRLARIGSGKLTADIDSSQTEIPVDDPGWFTKKTDMSTVMLGEELVRYNGVSAEAPWRLLKCERGAWGTKASTHRTGESVGKLMDHPYKVFLTDTSMALEVSRNVAAFCNYTGARQLSFDGLEGNWSTGMGQYGCVAFTKAWYDSLSPELRGHIINDSSNPHHYCWHIITRYNWGEPWYAGFRQSQTLYRLKNQLFYTRNLIPRMLGWFALRPETTLADVEWLCARAAGFDAGFAIATSFDSKATQTVGDIAGAEQHRTEFLQAIQRWETARHSGAFTADVKKLLQDVDREFHLSEVGQGEWELQPLKPTGPSVRLRPARKA